MPLSRWTTGEASWRSCQGERSTTLPPYTHRAVVMPKPTSLQSFYDVWLALLGLFHWKFWFLHGETSTSSELNPDLKKPFFVWFGKFCINEVIMQYKYRASFLQYKLALRDDFHPSSPSSLRAVRRGWDPSASLLVPWPRGHVIFSCSFTKSEVSDLFGNFISNCSFTRSGLLLNILEE